MNEAQQAISEKLDAASRHMGLAMQELRAANQWPMTDELAEDIERLVVELVHTKSVAHSIGRGMVAR